MTKQRADGSGVQISNSDRIGDVLFNASSDGAFEGTPTQRSILETAIENAEASPNEVADSVGCSTVWVEKVARRASKERIRDAFGDDLADAYTHAKHRYRSTFGPDPQPVNGSGVTTRVQLPARRTKDGIELFDKAGDVQMIQASGRSLAVVHSVEYCDECEQLHPTILLVDPGAVAYAAPPDHEHGNQFDDIGGASIAGLLQALISDE